MKQGSGFSHTTFAGALPVKATFLCQAIKGEQQSNGTGNTASVQEFAHARLYPLVLAAGLFLNLCNSNSANASPNSAIQRRLEQIYRHVDVAPRARVPTSLHLPQDGRPLLSPRTDIFVPLREVPTSSILKIVRINVWQFYSRFNAGLKNPHEHLMLTRSKQPELVDAWLRTPKNKRVFIIGSGQDNALAKAVSDRLRRIGLTPFFYLDCKPRCSEEFIGAMMATAEHPYYLNTAWSRKSRYVEVEVAAARRHKLYQSEKPVVIPAVELLETIKSQAEGPSSQRYIQCRPSAQSWRTECSDDF